MPVAGDVVTPMSIHWMAPESGEKFSTPVCRFDAIVVLAVTVKMELELTCKSSRLPLNELSGLRPMNVPLALEVELMRFGPRRNTVLVADCFGYPLSCKTGAAVPEALNTP